MSVSSEPSNFSRYGYPALLGTGAVVALYSGYRGCGCLFGKPDANSMRRLFDATSCRDEMMKSPTDVSAFDVRNRLHRIDGFGVVAEHKEMNAAGVLETSDCYRVPTREDVFSLLQSHGDRNFAIGFAGGAATMALIAVGYRFFSSKSDCWTTP